MSMNLFLNPRLTTEQAMSLHKMQIDGAMSIANTFRDHLKTMDDPKARKLYFDAMYPMVMQQLMMAMF